jgi:hypothetical protein
MMILGLMGVPNIWASGILLQIIGIIAPGCGVKLGFPA